MLNRTTLFGLLCATVLVLTLDVRRAPVGVTQMMPRATCETRTRAPDEPRVDVREEQLTSYTLDRMKEWPPAVIPAVPYEPLARDIAQAALKRGSSDPAADAVFLAGLAYWEGARFAHYVDAGLCNDEGWRESGEDQGWTASMLIKAGGNCDHGRAHTLWQIWPKDDPTSPLYAKCRSEIVTRDRVGAALCALAIASSDESLCRYTGETWPHCPKAEERLEFARQALSAHPFQGGVD